MYLFYATTESPWVFRVYVRVSESELADSSCSSSISSFQSNFILHDIISLDLFSSLQCYALHYSIVILSMVKGKHREVK